MQSLADAGGTCLSEAQCSAPDVAPVLAGHKVEAFDAPLRGVEGNASIRSIRHAMSLRLQKKNSSPFSAFIASESERMGKIKAPKLIVFVARLPRLETGKLHKKRLREQFRAVDS